jgi:hypothetical protein
MRGSIGLTCILAEIGLLDKNKLQAEGVMDFSENENQILVTSSMFDGVFMFVANSFKGLMTVGILIFAITAQIEGVQRFLYGFILVLFGWEVLSVMFGVVEVYFCRFDKLTRKMYLIKRDPFTFWFPRKSAFQFDGLASIVFSENIDNEKKLTLDFKNDEQISFAGSASMRIAEAVSNTLRIPLRIRLGDEYIVHVPWMSGASLIPTPCLSCGAPLPKIEFEARNAKCSHCGMTMVIQWEKDRFSYRKQIG